jgi:hypothetical protein
MNKYQVINDSRIEVYYLFRCDDKNRPNGISTDVIYTLSDYEKVTFLANELNTMGINYDLLIEWFDSSTDEVLGNDYIVANNFKN